MLLPFGKKFPEKVHNLCIGIRITENEALY